MSNDNDPEGGYTNRHRAFLQALLARQTISYEEAKPILALIETAATPERPTVAEDITRDDFEAYIHMLNSQISAFDLEIRVTQHQVTRQQTYALVNVYSDALMQMSTVRSADEIGFVKRVLDAMFETHNKLRAEVMAITETQALQCAKVSNESSNRRESASEGGGATQAAANTALTMSHAETLLKSLVAEGWFEKSEMGFYSLSPRALMELKGWLMETYEDEEDDEGVAHVKINFCQGCKEIVTVGQRCPTMACKARMHDHCVRNTFRAQGGQEKCPICKVDWADPPPVGEKAARSGARRSGPAQNGSRRNGTRTSRSEEDDDNNDGVSD